MTTAESPFVFVRSFRCCFHIQQSERGGVECSELVSKPTKCDIDIQLEYTENTGSSRSGFSPIRFSPLHRHNPGGMRDDHNEGKN